eukprot:CAMPEP_0176398188 /NCGR_PEP_ID=MMETSP0126-20121128/45736_1 /TAXON_ID=141414 ORGANISM="Strombidinopsis acuminatum, Strain SPMC142" /NCGR_SAMPLE_ID=MMETSP0126 /ASSEMBLY_ACC=CAM_ASM_000229 /LENGTH=49 /DNA_ID=CAMNT_0017772971 /DNA_START=445 /DNA_END=594 /DNA_ORIENTATION=-
MDDEDQEDEDSEDSLGLAKSKSVTSSKTKRTPIKGEEANMLVSPKAASD